MKTHKLLPISLFFLLALVACGGEAAVEPQATLVQVTPLATDTAVPPTAVPEPTAAPPTATALPPTEAPPTATPAPTLAERMDAFMIEETEAGRFSGVALVARGNEILFSNGYGYADREQNIPNTPQTRFPIGTVTLPFTAMAIMQLQEQGKLNIDDPLCDYLEDCPEAWSAVELRHLLAQSSGISLSTNTVDYQEDTGTSALPPTVVAQIQDGSLLFTPGSIWMGGIDQASFLLLGLVIERASGQPYETFLRENILVPLGMTETGLARENPQRAAGYNASSSPNPITWSDLSSRFSASGLTSTMDDMVRWGQGLLSGELASAATMDTIFDTYTPMGGGFHTGLGWFMSQFDGHYSASMPGVGPTGYKADMVVFPEDDLMWIILANQGDVNSSHIGDTLIRMVLAEE